MLSRNRLNGKRRGKKIAVNLVLISKQCGSYLLIFLLLKLELQVFFEIVKQVKEMYN